MSFLREFFDERIIFLHLWPPCTPDLTPLDTFLWGNLKNKVFATAPRTVQELKRRITYEINGISYTVFHLVFQNMVKRLRLCKKEQEGYIQHLL